MDAVALRPWDAAALKALPDLEAQAWNRSLAPTLNPKP